MWFDRITGKQVYVLPELIESGRYQIGASSLLFNGHTSNLSGVLVDDGSELCKLDKEERSFAIPQQTRTNNKDLLFKAIETIDIEMQQKLDLISPLMPAAIIDDQSHLLLFEKRLLDVVRSGHLHQISQHPRLDLQYKVEVVDMARARRLAKNALTHLAAHSECWQRQTLSGVIPKKILARFSEDDYDIYENRVYSHLLDKVEFHLRGRLSTLRSLQETLEQALDFYQSADIDFRLSNEVCRLWGMTFDQGATSKASNLLSTTLDTLQYLHKTISGLQQSGLYTLIGRNVKVAGALHMTNILCHDPHYRHLAILWQFLDKVRISTRVTPEENYNHHVHLVQAYSRYAGLVLRHSLQPYLHGTDEALWAGRKLRLRQNGLEWELLSTTIGKDPVEKILLTVVPWFSISRALENLQIPVNRFIAWPSIGQLSDKTAFRENWIALSPSDLYCVERFGQLVDRELSREVLQTYGEPLTKIPQKVLNLALRTPEMHVDIQSHQLSVREVLSDSILVELINVLLATNAAEQKDIIELRNQELIALQQCPICKGGAKLVFQNPFGFMANCDSCGAERYFRCHKDGWEFEQKISDVIEFRTSGRRAMMIKFSSAPKMIPYKKSR